jgi:pilus assembly protein CpaB
MNRRFILALAASVLFGLVAILVFQKILQNRLEGVQRTGQTQIVYAATRIPAGTTIAPHQLKLIYQAAQAIPEGSFANPQDAVGRVPVVDVEPNLPVTAKNTTTADKAGTLTSLKPGMRAVSIRVDEASSVSGFAQPGSYVDVGAVLSPSPNSKPISKILVQNLRVLAYGRDTQAKTEGTRSGGTVTLEVTQAQASMLALAGREGPLYLILRHPADKEPQPETIVQIGGMVDGYKDEPSPRPTTTPQPTPQFYPPYYVTPTPRPDPTTTPSPTSRLAVRVIAGDKSSEVTVRQ